MKTYSTPTLRDRGSVVTHTLGSATSFSNESSQLKNLKVPTGSGAEATANNSSNTMGDPV